MQNNDTQTHSLRTIGVIGLKCMNSMKYAKFVEEWLFYLISRENLCNAISLHGENCRAQTRN